MLNAPGEPKRSAVGLERGVVEYGGYSKPQYALLMGRGNADALRPKVGSVQLNYVLGGLWELAFHASTILDHRQKLLVASV